MTEYGRLYREALYCERRKRQTQEDIKPYVQLLSDIYATAIPRITIKPDGECDVNYKLNAEAESLVANIHKVIEMEAEKCREDILTYGQGFSKQTSFPPYIEHVSYGEIYCKPGGVS